MKSIVLIIPYFGKLPNYFNVWKMSALRNETIDFMFFTDVEELKAEKNIKVIHISFDAFKEKIQSKFGFPISLKRPYKLCDYKPSYGYVLQDYIKEYDFWGHCDIDLIFGNIRTFITDEILENNFKILEHGHFTLYRNDKKTNTLFMQGNGYGDYGYKKVYTSDDSLYFDECLGTQLLFRKLKIATYCKRSIFFDVATDQKPFKHLDGTQNVIFKYEYGKLFALKQGAQRLPVELMYAHFQKRKMDYSLFSEELKEFYIVPNRLIVSPIDENKLFECKGNLQYRLYRKWIHIKEYIRRYKTGKYKSFHAYRQERTRLHNDIENAKRIIANWSKETE